jgi:hypothetical protein
MLLKIIEYKESMISKVISQYESIVKLCKLDLVRDKSHLSGWESDPFVVALVKDFDEFADVSKKLDNDIVDVLASLYIKLYNDKNVEYRYVIRTRISKALGRILDYVRERQEYLGLQHKIIDTLAENAEFGHFPEELKVLMDAGIDFYEYPKALKAAEDFIRVYSKHRPEFSNELNEYLIKTKILEAPEKKQAV